MSHVEGMTTKRKADVTFDDNDDISLAEEGSSAEEEDSLPNVNVSATATKKTPGGAASNTGTTAASKATTPGSSGGSGMRMRSGRKKKKHIKSTSLEDEEEDTAAASAAARKSKRARKKTKKNLGTPHQRTSNVGEMEQHDYAHVHMDNEDDEGEKIIPANNFNSVKTGHEEKKMDDDDYYQGSSDDEDEDYGTATTTTARKVPLEVTLEAIAAAQVAKDNEDTDESIDEEEEEEEETINDDDDHNIKVIPPVIADGGGISNHPVGLLFSNLLMSSSTSSSIGRGAVSSNSNNNNTATVIAAAAALPPPPPPPRRRLIFETAQKQQQQQSNNISNNINGPIHQNNRFLSSQTRKTAAAATTTTNNKKATTTPMTNKAKHNNNLQQKQQHHQEGIRIIESTSNTSTSTTITPQYKAPELFIHYIKSCFLILLTLCLLGNNISISLLGSRQNIINNNNYDDESTIVGFRGGAISMYKHVNIMEKSVQWGKWYTIIDEETQSGLEVNDKQDDEDDDDDDDDDEDNDTMLESTRVTTTITDPIQLEYARTEMMSHYTLVHEIEKQTQIGNTYRDSIAEIDDVIQGWMNDYTDIDFEKLVINDDNEISYSNNETNRFQANNVMEQQQSLLKWESALSITEEAVTLLTEGKINPIEVNDELTKLAILSKVPIDARVLGTIHVPGEGCEGMDYIPLEQDVVDDENFVDDDDDDDVGLIKIGALDPASNIPVHVKYIQAIKEELLLLTQQMSKEVPELDIKWVQDLVHAELPRQGVDEGLPSIDELHKPITIKMINAPSSISLMMHDVVYTAHDAVNDIDLILEREDADLTGKYDYASINNGAKVLRRGPFATSSSLYETLPLLNRVLAYTKLRFYGHPPEVALLPTFPIHARGQCWSFPNESTNALSRQRVGSTSGIANDLLGLYATLSVRLASAVSVTEIMVEHNPTVIPHKSSSASSSSSAIKHFRVLGFVDGGAFGDPLELGSFTFIPGSSISQTTFSIPAMLDGQRIPKMKVISIAVDSNGGARYSCLYRVRVHGI